MNFLIRADSSQKIGSGHIMRCLTLAEKLKACSHDCSFICRDLPGNMISLIKQKKFPVHHLPPLQSEGPRTDDCDITPSLFRPACLEKEIASCITVAENLSIDWLIVDHYELDRIWHSSLRPFTKKIMVIDDLANRRLDCDLLLDQNYYSNMAQRYQNLIPPDAVKLLGPDYALLRDEFLAAKTKKGKKNSGAKKILVFFGGSDPTDETTKTIEAVSLLRRTDISVDIVVGKSNPRRNTIKSLCSPESVFSYFCQVENMAELMAGADLCVGAGGSSIWERCYLGLPSLVIVTADNQVEVTKAVADKGAHEYLGRAEQVTVQKISTALNRLLDNPKKLERLTVHGLALMKGHRDTSVPDALVS